MFIAIADTFDEEENIARGQENAYCDVVQGWHGGEERAE